MTITIPATVFSVAQKAAACLLALQPTWQSCALILEAACQTCAAIVSPMFVAQHPQGFPRGGEVWHLAAVQDKLPDKCWWLQGEWQELVRFFARDG